MNSQEPIKLQDFLKTYTTINSKFIDDFFGLYDINTSDSDFVIDLDKVVKWLKTLKKHIKKTLIESYSENLDYKIKVLPPKGRGRPVEEITLTPTCFKRLCMMSRTEKAEEVRTYFIQLEAYMDKYKSHIINALQKKIAKIEGELKPIPEIKKGGVIYVLKTKDADNIFKIGRSKNFENRLKTHQSSHSNKIEIAFVFETDDIESVENCMKGLLKDKQYRKNKEFYEIDLEILRSLIESCNCMNMMISNKEVAMKDPKCSYIIKILENAKKSKNVLYDVMQK